MVENSALQYLRAAVRLSIYRHIQALGSHRLSFADWQESIDLGVLLPVARSELQSWAPAMADYNSGSSRSEEHTSELQSLMRISYAVFCLQKKNKNNRNN